METCWDGGDLPPEEVKKMLSLSLAPGIGPAAFRCLMEAFGSAEAVFGAAAAELTVVLPKLKTESLQAILAGPNPRAVRFQEEACMRLHVRIVSERSPAYPSPLLTLSHPPPFLFMAGEWRPEDRAALAVVGTRYPSAYGTRMTRELSLGMAEAGWTLVSGLARGIDTLAHEAALAVRSRTVAVLGSGLDWIYPPENVPLARRIAKSGCVISEFPMGAAPHASHFPRRNRIISALSLGTLVVEAGNDSGALITAEYALEQGREIFAVPGAVQNPGSRGTHKLIQDGAHLVERPDDVARVLEGLSQAAPARRLAFAGKSPGKLPDRELPDREEGDVIGYETETKTDSAGAGVAGSTAAACGQAGSTVLESAAAGLDREARSLLSLIGREGLSLDSIAEKARSKPGFRDAAAHRLLSGLLELELKGRVKRLPGALFRRI